MIERHIKDRGYELHLNDEILISTEKSEWPPDEKTSHELMKNIENRLSEAGLGDKEIKATVESMNIILSISGVAKRVDKREE